MQSLTLPRRAAANRQRASKFDRAMTLAIPALIASLAAGAAYAGADTTFDPALTQFTFMPRYGIPQARRGRETGTPRHGLIHGLVPASRRAMISWVMRVAGDTPPLCPLR